MNATDAIAQEQLTLSIGRGELDVPRGWLTRQLGDRALLESPERDVRMLVVEVTRPEPITDAAAFLLPMWQQFVPGFSFNVERERDLPVMQGWDRIHSVAYATTVAQARVLQALLQRKGDRVYVMMLDASYAGVSRRGAQLGQITESIRTEGIGEESWAGRELHWLEGERLEQFRVFVRQAMQDLGVPGTAIGIVHGDQVYAEGFGVRVFGSNEPVTPDTLFMIGSTTKSFLTLVQARMVDEGALRWDEPLQALLPSFDLADHEIARRVQLRHSVCACTGMPRRDLDMLIGIRDRRAEDFVSELATFTPTTGFGETFQYSNHLVAVGGYATAHRAFPSLPIFEAWERMLQEKLLAPVQMNNTFTRISSVLTRNHAAPHARGADDAVRALDPEVERGVELAGPCGGLWSNVDDMMRYVRFNLAEGVLPNNEHWVSRENYHVRETPGVRISASSYYGIGLFVDQSHGLHSFGHGGDTLGFASEVSWNRDYDLGIVMLSNLAGANGLHAILMRKLMSLMLDAQSAPDAEAMLADAIARRHRRREDWAPLLQTPVSPESLRAWLGTYRTDAGKHFALIERDGRVVFDEGTWSSRIALHPQGEQPATLVLIDPPLVGIELVRDESGGRKALALPTGQITYRFVRDDQ